MKKFIAFLIGTAFLGLAISVAVVMYLNSQLPKMITVADYKPLLVSEVFDRNGTKIGEFSLEKRTLVPFDKIPKVVIDAFLAAEDSTFFTHSGINYIAITRAMLANLRAGEKVQGASTITQQVARSILLQTNEKTYTRKIKEILLAYQMESNLSKQDILFLYLNQIFLGQKAYGVAVAADVYFNKSLDKVTLPEAAILAGLPKAPSAYSPLRNPSRAKERQRYVLGRMADEGMITKAEAQKAGDEPLKVYERRDYWGEAPFFLETVRQMLIARLGDDVVNNHGIRVFTSLDLTRQKVAAEQVKLGLRELDKRQGYRGPLRKIESSEEIAMFLLKERNKLLDDQEPFRVLQADGTIPDWGPLNLTAAIPVLPEYLKPGTLMQGIVTRVDDEWGIVYVRFAESKGLIDLDAMKWARKPDANVDARWAKEVEKPSEVLAKGDVIEIRVNNPSFSSQRIDDKIKEQKKKNKLFKLPNDFPNFKEFAQVELEQEPETQASLIAFDQTTQDVLALVGGYSFNEANQLNRALQTVRQTGSSFKPIVYASALDKGFNPATAILDAPIVFEEEQEVQGSDKAEMITKKWKPTNHSNKFMGDILFRNALIQSLNVPSVKIIEKLGVNWSADYARRLGIFSPLNLDFTLALGSSSVTLYEMTKAYSEFGRLGKRIRPVIVHKVTDKNGEPLLEKISLDERYATEYQQLEEVYEPRRQAYLNWEATQAGTDGTPPAPADGASAPTTDPSKEPPLFFKDPEQLLKPQTAYVLTSLLQGAVEEDGGTGQRAKALGRPTAGKTGTTSSYYDAWFIGYTADIATGVWVGYDTERSLGKGEVGGRAPLSIWVEFMRAAHENVPVRSFAVPEGIVFASIDNETGRLASANSKEVVKQAFIDGTEPKDVQDDSGSSSSDETKDFYKEDLSE
jgi:penicillin-binding protein 1A